MSNDERLLIVTHQTGAGEPEAEALLVRQADDDPRMVVLALDGEIIVADRRELAAAIAG